MLQRSDGDEGDVVWVVFDKDDFADNYSNAISLAEAKGMRAAYSNECFELWLLLHFQDQSAPISRHKLADLLKQRWEESSDKGVVGSRRLKHFPYGMLRRNGKRVDAIERAERLYTEAVEKQPSDPWNVNPVSTVYQLVESLLEFFNIAEEKSVKDK
jgi:hypothetical protein